MVSITYLVKTMVFERLVKFFSRFFEYEDENDELPPPMSPSVLRRVPTNPRYWCKCGAGLRGLYSSCDACGRDIAAEFRVGLQIPRDPSTYE